MELDVKKFSLAAASTMAIVYIVCVIFVSLWPDFSLRLLGWLIHLVNVDKFLGDVRITLGGAIIGLIQVWLYTYIGGWLFGVLHNRFMKQTPTV